MKKLYVFLGMFSFLSFSAYSEKQCFILKENETVLVREGNCSEPSAPSSTFKIPLSVIGFDAGYLQDETHPELPFETGCVDWLDKWKQPQNPKTWLANSCLWYSQFITRLLGQERLEQYLEKFDYGNKDVSGTPGKNNQLTDSWISSSLQISPDGQMIFLEKLLGSQLPTSLKSQEMTKKNLYVRDLPNGWKLYGKTGAGSYQDENGVKDESRPMGWFIGWAEKDDRKLIFVERVMFDTPQEDFASVIAKDAVIVHLFPYLDS